MCACACGVKEGQACSLQMRTGGQHRLTQWVWVLLCISRWPLKVALCHNTLAPTTPAAGKCHRPLLSARFRRQSSIPQLLLHYTSFFLFAFYKINIFSCLFWNTELCVAKQRLIPYHHLFRKTGTNVLSEVDLTSIFVFHKNIKMKKK